MQRSNLPDSTDRTGNPGGSLLNIRQAAEYLGISHHTLYRLVERREVPAAKVGGSWRLSRDALEAFIHARSASTSLKVLVLEPSDEDRERLLGFARRIAMHVVAARDAEDAVRIAADMNPDVIFMSASLPDERSPAEVIGQIDETGASSRIVLMVASDEAHLVADPLVHGPVIVLRRPVDRADVVSILTLVTP